LQDFGRNTSFDFVSFEDVDPCAWGRLSAPELEDKVFDALLCDGI